MVELYQAEMLKKIRFENLKKIKYYANSLYR